MRSPMVAMPRPGAAGPAGMKRAAQLFDFDERGSDCALIEKVWSARGTPEPAFLSVAETHWQIVVTTSRDRTGVVVRGPDDAARVTPIPEGAEFFGIVLRLGSFMPSGSLSELIGGADVRPNASDTTFWLAGSRWEIPTPENADVFVDRLIRQELVVHDPLVMRALRRDDDAMSLRTMQRRVRRATGMTQSAIRQIRRAHAAVDALGRGSTVAQVTQDLGFADQPHLTRSLRRFIGQTPAQVLDSGGHWSASSPLGRPDPMVADAHVSLPFKTRRHDGL